MIRKLKNLLYFPLANYFAFFALIQLKLWKPQVILITGSAGKTTLLNLIESQLGDVAHYSHLANSAFGIPFDILGLKRYSLKLGEWPLLFLLAPFKAFRKCYQQSLYVVEADCDRIGEGKFLASLLKPEVTLWTDSSISHSQNFDHPEKIAERIAFEFGYFIANTSKMIIVNCDNLLILKQLSRTPAKIIKVSKKQLKSYLPALEKTEFQINEKKFTLPALVPEEVFYALSMTLAVLNYLGAKPDLTFSKFSSPAGRSNVLPGLKGSILIDSSYNATPSSMAAILRMFNQLKTTRQKWLVISDMIELGSQEKAEHQRLARLIKTLKFDKVFLMGPRLINFTLPVLGRFEARYFETPKQLLDFLRPKLSSQQVILFKGARFLEGVIQHLLQNPQDINKLPRREKIWQQRRAKWEL